MERPILAEKDDREAGIGYEVEIGRIEITDDKSNNFVDFPHSRMSYFEFQKVIFKSNVQTLCRD